jgi:hypothetical protein
MQKQWFVIAATVLLAAFVTVAFCTINSANAQGNTTSGSGAAKNMTNDIDSTAKNMINCHGYC